MSLSPAERAELVAEVLSEVAAALEPAKPVQADLVVDAHGTAPPDLRLVRRRLWYRADRLRERAEEIRKGG